MGQFEFRLSTRSGPSRSAHERAGSAKKRSSAGGVGCAKTGHVSCGPIFSDTAAGKSIAGRPQLAEAFDDLAEGDELAIAEWDRARRLMWDGLRIIKAVIDARTSIKVLDRSYTT